MKQFTPPTTPAELTVAKLWREVLGVKQVGLHDNFFELGGHSLMATQLISRFEKFHQVKVSLRQIFDSPTVAEMSRWLEKKAAQEAPLKTELAPLTRRNAQPRETISTSG